MDKKNLSVFFYGLFMDEALLASKGVRPLHSTVAYVDGWCLRIGDRATIFAEAESRAYGVLMGITQEDADTLYSEQSVADYVARPVDVTLPDGSTVAAVSYTLPPDKLAGANPGYAAALLGLARELGFPDSYLEHIRKEATAI